MLPPWQKHLSATFSNTPIIRKSREVASNIGTHLWFLSDILALFFPIQMQKHRPTMPVRTMGRYLFIRQNRSDVIRRKIYARVTFSNDVRFLKSDYLKIQFFILIHPSFSFLSR